jgi:hypothetical protein
MTKNELQERVATLGYGYHLPETKVMLGLACQDQRRDTVREACIKQWPQASATNKEKMWSHLSRRFLEVDGDKIIVTPFLQMYGGLKREQEKLDLIFYQLCQSTPLLLAVLRSLAKDKLLDTGTASFTKFHLDQILESHFGHVTRSTSERVRQILRESGRLRQDGPSYLATGSCPSDAVLGFGIYADANHHGWRAPSTAVILLDSDVTAAFLCTRPLLIGGIDRLARQGHCDYHTHGTTDQVQLVYTSLQEFVNAWLS